MTSREDAASANLVIDGSNSVLVNTGEELIDLLERPGRAQRLLLAGVKEEVDARIVSLYPEVADEVITQRAVGATSSFAADFAHESERQFADLSRCLRYPLGL